MAKVYVVAVRDRAVDAFMNPFVVPALGIAIRGFQDEVNRHDAEAVISRHPEDYDLYSLAVLDMDTGLFSENTPKQIAIGKDMVRHVS